MVTEIEIFKSPYVILLNFCSWGWKKIEVYGGCVDKPEELLAGTLDVAASIKKREDQLRRAARNLRARVANCIETDGGILEHLFRIVTNFFISV
jgi:hypothetical protein